MKERAIEIAVAITTIALVGTMSYLLGSWVIFEENRREIEIGKKSYHGHCPICYTKVNEKERSE